MANSPVAITDEKLLHQWRSVLRLKMGGEVILFAGSGTDFRCEIVTLEKKEATCVIREVVKNEVVPLRELILFPALIKKDHFEWLLEKVTELGVAEIRPVVSERTEVKKVNVERARDIVKEATEQSGRGTLPDIAEPVSFESALSSVSVPAIAFDPSGSPFHTSEFILHDSISAFIGPEGGWSPRELALFSERNIPLYSLSTATLRAETAGVVVTTLLLLQS